MGHAIRVVALWAVVLPILLKPLTSQGAPSSRHFVRGQEGEITLLLIPKGLLTHSPWSATLAPEHVRAFCAHRAPCPTAYGGLSTGRALGVG
jgi:hypothetical protein